MRAEYDFSDGVRGKHYKAYRQGHLEALTKLDSRFRGNDMNSAI